MTQSRPRLRSAVWLWLLAIAVSLSGVALVLGLGTLAPVFLQESAAGAAGRLVVAAVCFAAFIGAHRRERHLRRQAYGH